MSSDAAIRQMHGEPLTTAEAVGLFVHDMWGEPFNNMAAAIMGRPAEPVAEAIWRHRDMYRAFLPDRAAKAGFLRDLLNALLDFVDLGAA